MRKARSETRTSRREADCNGYGRVKDAPNPLQRKMLSSPRLISIYAAWLVNLLAIGPLLLLLTLFGGFNVWLALALFLGLGVIGPPVFAVFSGLHRRSRSELENSLTAYLPWFMGSRTHKAGSGIDANSASRGPLGEAPNPLQRLAVRHLVASFGAGFCVLSTMAASPFIVGGLFGSGKMLWVALGIYTLGLVRAAIAYWRSPLRHMSPSARSEFTVRYFPWTGG